MNAASYHVYVYWCILHLGIDWESKYSEGAALTSFSVSNYHTGSGFCSLWRGAGTVLFLLIHPSALLSLSSIPSTFIYISFPVLSVLFSFSLYFFILLFSFSSTSLALSSFWRLDLSYRGSFAFSLSFSPPCSHTYCRPPASIMHLKQRRLKDRRLGLPSLEFFNIN